MGFNFIEEGRRMPYIVPASTTIVEGQVVQLADTIGIAMSNAVTDSNGVLVQGAGTDPYLISSTIMLIIGGVVALPKAVTTGSAIAQGTKVYWDPSVSQVTDTAGSLKAVGFVWLPNVDASATVQVLINKGV